MQTKIRTHDLFVPLITEMRCRTYLKEKKLYKIIHDIV